MTDRDPHLTHPDAYHHQWRCGCGWVSQVTANGAGQAGAAMVRHMLGRYTGGES